MKRNTAIIVVAIIFGSLLLSGCVEENAKGTRAQQMTDNQPTKNISHSNERDTFAAYLDQVGDPNNIQFIYIFDSFGHVLLRAPVMGKTLSATKSTDPYERFALGYSDANNEDDAIIRALPGFVEGTPQLMNPSGMYGHDTPGVIWRDPNGKFHEWHDGPYLITSYPVKLKEPVLNFRDIDQELITKIEVMERTLKAGGNLTQEEKDYLMNS